MGKPDPKDKDARILVRQFCNHVFDLRRTHLIGKELFEDQQAQSLMERTAKVFFEDINTILINHFILEVAKLTDPAKCAAGRHENFTIANLCESIKWPDEVSKELLGLQESVLKFRQYIVPARNKLLAHYDKQTVLSESHWGPSLRAKTRS